MSTALTPHPNQHTARQNFNPDTQIRYPWERSAADTDRAYEAFEVYMNMGSSRSLARVAEKLGKSTTIIERWSKRDNWVARVLAWDRHQSRMINERVVLGTAEMRQRVINQALVMQARAQARLAKMTEEEVATLKPSEIVSLMRAASDMERRAREVELDDPNFQADTMPNFEIQIIQPGDNMVGVQLADGRCGYIPEEQVDRFRQENPTAVVII